MDRRTSEPAIAMLPYGVRAGPHIATMPLDRLLWPLGRPPRLADGQVSDLAETDHLIVTPGTMVHFRRHFGTRARVSIVVVEPSSIHRKHLQLLKYTYRRFFRVLSYNEDLLAAIPNGLFLPFGHTFIPDWKSLDLSKRAMVSLIASKKRDTQGHLLRHSVAEWVRDTGQDVALMGRGYAPFEHKHEGLAPFRYSVVIENTRERNYFSEKLIDALFCDTVPIYWGCPNLDRFIDTSCVIQCASEADVRRAVQAVRTEDFRHRLPKVQQLKLDLERLCDYNRNAALAILASL